MPVDLTLPDVSRPAVELRQELPRFPPGRSGGLNFCENCTWFLTLLARKRGDVRLETGGWRLQEGIWDWVVQSRAACESANGSFEQESAEETEMD